MLFLVCSVAFIYSLLIEWPFLAIDKFLMGFLSKSPTKHNRIRENIQTEMNTIQNDSSKF
jgi:hypothetical protein